MAKAEKRVVTIGVSSIAELNDRLSRAVKSGVFEGHRISFLSLELLWSTLTPKRWDILRAMTSQGPLSAREVARRVGRDIKAVHGDIRRLSANGLVQKTEGGRVEFPYDEIRVEFGVGPATAIAQPDLKDAVHSVVAARRSKPAAKLRAKAAQLIRALD